jgi:phage head maturation protease
MDISQVSSTIGVYYPFIEEIAPGAFDDCLNDDVRCLLTDPNYILARSKEGKGINKWMQPD